MDCPECEYPCASVERIDQDQSRTAKVKAVAPSAMTLSQARESTSPTALLVVELAEEVTGPALAEEVWVPRVELVDEARVVDVLELEEEEEEEGSEAELEELDPPMTGGGTACEGSTRVPLPQGIAAPLTGCVASVGGVLFPSTSAIVKRLVHDRVELKGEENW